MKHASPDALYISVSEALARAGCGKTTFYALLKTGAIRGVRKLGRTTIVSVEGLKAYLDSLPEIGASA